MFPEWFYYYFIRHRGRAREVRVYIIRVRVPSVHVYNVNPKQVRARCSEGAGREDVQWSMQEGREGTVS